jgi:hypothetical protein
VRLCDDGRDRHPSREESEGGEVKAEVKIPNGWRRLKDKELCKAGDLVLTTSIPGGMGLFVEYLVSSDNRKCVIRRIRKAQKGKKV